MIESLKSVAFVIATVMIALILQAHAGKLAPEQANHDAEITAEQMQVYN